jgi:two-component system OmpR family response regulator
MKKRRLLVVDDSAICLDLASRTLTAAGYTVETAADGDEGYLAARAQRFDGFVLDLMMPVDAPSMLRRLFTDGHEPPPCLVMSGMPRADVYERFGRRVRYVRKPFLPATLVRAVRRAHGDPL